MRRPPLLLAWLLGLTPGVIHGQTRSMTQDSTLNNLRLSPGTPTSPVGTLGRVRKVGDGSRAMILIAGMGFGDAIWTEFMERRKADYAMYAITLPGFGGTPPLAMPAEGTRFADAAWIGSSTDAIRALMDRERLNRVTLVAHWAVATQIALRLALDHPDRIDAVVVISGAYKFTVVGRPETTAWTPAQRADFMETFGERWFKTVTRQTWDDNNFMPYDYAVNPRRGLFLWREAQTPSLPVWIRYLLEYYATDVGSRLPQLRVPTLVVHPDFEDTAFYVETSNYMKGFTTDSWAGTQGATRDLEFAKVAGSRLFIMYDKPDELDQVVNAFLRRVRAIGARRPSGR